MIRSLSRRLTTKRDDKDSPRSTPTSPRRHRRYSSITALDPVDENRNIQSEPPDWVKREYEAANVPIPPLPPSASFTSGYTSSMLLPAAESAPPVLEAMKIAPPIPEMPSESFSSPSVPSSPQMPTRGLVKSFSIKRALSRRAANGNGGARKASEGLSEMMQGLGDPIKTVEMPSRRRSVDLSMRIITDVRTAGSYTWLQRTSDGKATISVPGMPDRWIATRGRAIGVLRPSRQPPRLPDLIDYNAAMCPTAPLAPISHALVPDALDGVSLITDRSNLRKLHTFLLPATDEQHSILDFRMDSELVNGVVQWTRWEPLSHRRPQVMSLSYAPALIEAVTSRSPGIDAEGGTMALVRYRLGQLDVLARFEVDAAFDEMSKKSEQDEPEPPSRDSSALLNVKPHYRQHTPHELYMDLKVLSAGSDIDLTSTYINMLYAQLVRVCIAEHDRGNFRAPKIIELGSAELSDIAREQEATVAKVAFIAGKIVESTRKHERVAVICQAGAIQLYKIGAVTSSRSP